MCHKILIIAAIDNYIENKKILKKHNFIMLKCQFVLIAKVTIIKVYNNYTCDTMLSFSIECIYFVQIISYVANFTLNQIYLIVVGWM